MKMLFNDTVQHNKPHVHVYYGEYAASVGIDGKLLTGSLPHKQLKMLIGWLALHEEEAYTTWNKAVRGEHFDKIKPLYGDALYIYFKWNCLRQEKAEKH